nr:MAG TPA: hypothetical protein [Caudoviricetes sp.]
MKIVLNCVKIVLKCVKIVLKWGSAVPLLYQWHPPIIAILTDIN